MSVPSGSETAIKTLPFELGRYRLDRVLGRGAMGTVYLAYDKQLNRPVALKMPKFAEGSPANMIERFYREARLAAGLNHANISVKRARIYRGDSRTGARPVCTPIAGRRIRRGRAH